VLGLGIRQDPHVMQLWSDEQLDHPETLHASDGELQLGFAELAEQIFGPMLAQMAGP